MDDGDGGDAANLMLQSTFGAPSSAAGGAGSRATRATPKPRKQWAITPYVRAVLAARLPPAACLVSSGPFLRYLTCLIFRRCSRWTIASTKRSRASSLGRSLPTGER